jgi:NADH-quinone oxidoreductase subunit C
MPVLSHAEELRERLQRDLPGAVVLPPPPPEPAAEGEEPEPKAKGKEKPDFLTTSDTVVVAERLTEVAHYLRDTLGYEYLSDIAVVDYLADDLFELVYRFYHLDGGGDVVVKVRVPRGQPVVPALTPTWPGANFHEREGFDLFGITFQGHPDLRRLYLWEEFEGHPMRKDFPRQGDKYLT